LAFAPSGFGNNSGVILKNGLIIMENSSTVEVQKKNEKGDVLRNG